jgi:hypothetical protein
VEAITLISTLVITFVTQDAQVDFMMTQIKSVYQDVKQTSMNRLTPMEISLVSQVAQEMMTFTH